MRNLSESKILYDNFKHYGIDLEECFKEAGKKYTEVLINKFGKRKVYAVVCGLAGNGTDGLATALELARNEVQVKLYIAGRVNLSEDETFKKLFKTLNLERKKYLEFLTVKQDVYAKDILRADVIIEALVGTGISKEKLNIRFSDIVRRISHFNAPIVALDVPTPHYTPNFTISLNYPKVENAKVVNVDYPTEATMLIGPGEINALWKPKKKTHKLKNGNLLLISQKKKTEFQETFEACARSYEVFSKYFYFSTEASGKDYAKVLTAKELRELIESSDSVVIDKLEDSLINFATANYILKHYSSKRYILLGSALSTIELASIKEVEDVVLILDRRDISELFGKLGEKVSAVEGRLKRFCIEHKVNAVLIGSQTLMYSKEGEMKMHRSASIYNKDFKAKLASLIGAFSTKNDLWLSIRAGVFLA